MTPPPQQLTRIAEADEESDSGSVNKSLIDNATVSIGKGDNDDDAKKISMAYAGGNDTILCYCLPCLSFGRGEQGRNNIKSLFYLMVPLTLLFSFFAGSGGHNRHNMMHDATMNYAEMNELAMNDLGHNDDRVVNDLHFRSFRLQNWPTHKREVLLRIPEQHMHVEVNGETKEVIRKCPRGFLFLFHGCHRYAASFFYSPQGRRMVSMALEQGLVIVAFKKHDETACWSWEHDGEVVLNLGKKFLETRYEKGVCPQNEEGKTIYPPNFAFGHSSGGLFVAKLADAMSAKSKMYEPFLFSAINIQGTAPTPQLGWEIPTMFTVMNGDASTSLRVHEFMQNNHPRPFQKIATSGKKTIESNHFVNVFQDDPQMSNILSQQIHGDLVTLGVIDGQTNELLRNPRHSQDAIAAIASVCQKYDSMMRKQLAKLEKKNQKDVLPFGVSSRLIKGLHEEELHDAECIWLIEELNVAWDESEITVEGFEDVLNYFVQE